MGLQETQFFKKLLKKLKKPSFLKKLLRIYFSKHLYIFLYKTFQMGLQETQFFKKLLKSSKN